jgi:hypothetical protein
MMIGDQNVQECDATDAQQIDEPLAHKQKKQPLSVALIYLQTLFHFSLSRLTSHYANVSVRANKG